MINFLSGGPGCGKSYEATVYHVLPAVQEGRKVVTNLALVVDEIAAIEPRARELIELRTRTLADRDEYDRKAERARVLRSELPPWNDAPFSHVEDYRDPWRDEKGRGPLYVIDEAHMSLPRADTPRAVLEWYAMHRHEGVDVLLLSQRHRKVATDVIDLVQCHYRVRKKTLWGQPDRYIRKVQDGIRGADMAETEREYQARYFKLYKSHTKSLVAVAEADAKDVTPSFKKWYRMAALLLVVAALGAVARLVVANGKESAEPKKPQRVAKVSEGTRASGEDADTKRQARKSREEVSRHPLDGMGIHVAGAIHGRKGYEYLFVVSQGGMAQFNQTKRELELAGYQVRWVNDCVAELRHEHAKPFFVRCDAPTQRIVAASSSSSGPLPASVSPVAAHTERTEGAVGTARAVAVRPAPSASVYQQASTSSTARR